MRAIIGRKNAFVLTRRNIVILLILFYRIIRERCRQQAGRKANPLTLKKPQRQHFRIIKEVTDE